MNEAARTTTPAQSGIEKFEDSELLRRYAEDGSQDAFAELVRRRIGLVYSVALRQTGGDRHRAQDVCQTVFSDLARKAPSLWNRPTLLGWLYRSAQFAAAGMIRAEQRRQNREIVAQHMYDTHGPDETNWEKLRPTLDEAMGDIDERDRDVILLRFFDERPYAEIGQRLRLTENAARMRGERALERLGAALAKRGITSTSAALGIALGQQVGVAAPAGLAATVTGTALAQAGAAGSGLAMLFGLTKVQFGIAAGIAALGTATFVLQRQTNAALRAEITHLQSRTPAMAALREENQRLASIATEVQRLRADDAEFRKLEVTIAELKRANDERLRVARTREVQQAQSKTAQTEIDRLNREGNALVEQFKALSAKARDLSLTQEERAATESAAKIKLAEIQAKQREVQAVIAAAKAANPDFEWKRAEPRTQAAVQREVEERKAQRAAVAAPDGSPVQTNGKITAVGERVSFRLPKADVVTFLSALESVVGTRINRDPSIAQVRGTADWQTDGLTKLEAAQALAAMIKKEFNVYLEPASDGTLTAKVGPEGWSFKSR